MNRHEIQTVLCSDQITAHSAKKITFIRFPGHNATWWKKKKRNLLFGGKGNKTFLWVLLMEFLVKPCNVRLGWLAGWLFLQPCLCAGELDWAGERYGCGRAGLGNVLAVEDRHVGHARDLWRHSQTSQCSDSTFLSRLDPNPA